MTTRKSQSCETGNVKDSPENEMNGDVGTVKHGSETEITPKHKSNDQNKKRSPYCKAVVPFTDPWIPHQTSKSLLSLLIQYRVLGAPSAMDRQINMSSLHWYNNVFGGIGNGASSMSGNIVAMSEKRKSSNDYSLAVQPLLKSKALTWFDENLMGLYWNQQQEKVQMQMRNLKKADQSSQGHDNSPQTNHDLIGGREREDVKVQVNVKIETQRQEETAVVVTREMEREANESDEVGDAKRKLRVHTRQRAVQTPRYPGSDTPSTSASSEADSINSIKTANLNDLLRCIEKCKKIGRRGLKIVERTDMDGVFCEINGISSVKSQIYTGLLASIREESMDLMAILQQILRRTDTSLHARQQFHEQGMPPPMNVDSCYHSNYNYGYTTPTYEFQSSKHSATDDRLKTNNDAKHDGFSYKATFVNDHQTSIANSQSQSRSQSQASQDETDPTDPLESQTIKAGAASSDTSVAATTAITQVGTTTDVNSMNSVDISVTATKTQNGMENDDFFCDNGYITPPPLAVPLHLADYPDYSMYPAYDDRTKYYNNNDNNDNNDDKNMNNDTNNHMNDDSGNEMIVNDNFDYNVNTAVNGPYGMLDDKRIECQCDCGCGTQLQASQPSQSQSKSQSHPRSQEQEPERQAESQSYQYDEQDEEDDIGEQSPCSQTKVELTSGNDSDDHVHIENINEMDKNMVKEIIPAVIQTGETDDIEKIDVIIVNGEEIENRDVNDDDDEKKKEKENEKNINTESNENANKNNYDDEGKNSNDRKSDNSDIEEERREIVSNENRNKEMNDDEEDDMPSLPASCDESNSLKWEDLTKLQNSNYSANKSVEDELNNTVAASKNIWDVTISGGDWPTEMPKEYKAYHDYETHQENQRYRKQHKQRRKQREREKYLKYQRYKQAQAKAQSQMKSQPQQGQTQPQPQSRSRAHVQQQAQTQRQSYGRSGAQSQGYRQTPLGGTPQARKHGTSTSTPASASPSTSIPQYSTYNVYSNKNGSYHRFQDVTHLTHLAHITPSTNVNPNGKSPPRRTPVASVGATSSVLPFVVPRATITSVTSAGVYSRLSNNIAKNVAAVANLLISPQSNRSGSSGRSARSMKSGSGSHGSGRHSSQGNGHRSGHRSGYNSNRHGSHHNNNRHSSRTGLNTTPRSGSNGSNGSSRICIALGGILNTNGTNRAMMNRNMTVNTNLNTNINTNVNASGTTGIAGVTGNNVNGGIRVNDGKNEKRSSKRKSSNGKNGRARRGNRNGRHQKNKKDKKDKSKKKSTNGKINSKISDDQSNFDFNPYIPAFVPKSELKAKSTKDVDFIDYFSLKTGDKVDVSKKAQIDEKIKKEKRGSATWRHEVALILNETKQDGTEKKSTNGKHSKKRHNKRGGGRSKGSPKVIKNAPNGNDQRMRDIKQSKTVKPAQQVSHLQNIQG